MKRWGCKDDVLGMPVIYFEQHLRKMIAMIVQLRKKHPSSSMRGLYLGLSLFFVGSLAIGQLSSAREDFVLKHQGAYHQIAVICSVSDQVADTATGSLDVTAVDTAPPVILVPGDILAESPDGSGVPVSFYVTARDAVEGPVAVVCSPASGSVFPLGVSTITCTAENRHGNTAAAAIHIIVTTNPERSTGATVPSGTGGTITTPDASVALGIPLGALNSDMYISVAETGAFYEYTSDKGNGTAVYGVAVEPHGTTFTTPVTLTFTWPDRDNDGMIDGTNLTEQDIVIMKNNVAITGRCKNEPGPFDVIGVECNMTENFFKFKVSSLSSFALVFMDDQGPLTSNISASPCPSPVNTPITISAIADNALRGGSTIARAEYKLDEGVFAAMNSADGVYNSVREGITAAIPAFAEPGVHSVCVQAWDSLENVAGPEECLFLPIYDPSGGFVTGGGWIISPAGAYVLNPELMGRATFGFVTKYLKGDKTLPGITEVQFKVANLNFQSESCEWLVIAGARAQHKGVGAINGTGAYGFLLTAIDGQLAGGGGSDKFRIKIWDKETGTVIYDNQLGADDAADPSAFVEGGSIIIQK